MTDPRFAKAERAVAQARVREMVAREVPPIPKGTIPDAIHLSFVKAIYKPDKRMG